MDDLLMYKVSELIINAPTVLGLIAGVISVMVTVTTFVMAAAISPSGKHLVVVTYNTVLKQQELQWCRVADAHIEFSTSI
jgi:hypothetical protein